MKKFGITFLLLLITACSITHTRKSTGELNKSDIASARMLDGRIWMTQNLDLPVLNSFYQKEDSTYIRRYGRLYTWEAAKEACALLGEEWRLPTNEEWQILAKNYGGFFAESEDQGKLAYLTLIEGGKAGYNAILGGNREADGKYERLEAHGFYWTATEHDSVQAWFINFAKGAPLLNRHTGDKNRALSVRCIKK